MLSAYNGYWLLVMILGAARLSLALFCSLSPELPAGTKTGMRSWVPYGLPLEILLSVSSALKSSQHHDKENGRGELTQPTIISDTKYKNKKKTFWRLRSFLKWFKLIYFIILSLDLLSCATLWWWGLSIYIFIFLYLIFKIVSFLQWNSVE